MSSSKKFTICYLHIGTEKTGTTTIQAFMAGNRQELLRRGVLYPTTFGFTGNHLQLAVYAQNDDKVDDLRRMSGVTTPEAVTQQRRNLERRFAEEVARCDKADRLVLSNEHCHSRLVTREEVQRLYDLLSPWCERFRIIAYLRPQHELAISRYSTRIKLGEPQGDPFKGVDPSADYYNYNRMLIRWATVFGREHIEARVFARGELVEGDVVADFLTRVGVEKEGLAAVPKQNESLSAQALDFLARLNPLVPPFIDGKPNPERGDIAEIMEKLYPGKGVLRPRAQVREVFERFTQSNHNACQGFFRGRDKLFEPDFSQYPEIVDSQGLTLDDAFRMFAEVWKRRGK